VTSIFSYPSTGSYPRLEAASKGEAPRWIEAIAPGQPK